MMKLAVFASGTGTNFDAIMQAIEAGKLDAEVCLLVCDKPQAKVVEKAHNYGVECFAFNPKDYASKQAYDTAILEKCKQQGAQMIILAGYMRIVSDVLLKGYPNRIINIHPSLLPAFKGKDAIGQAFAYGVKVMGVSIHYVNEELDGGNIIAQEAFAVNDMNIVEVTAKTHEIEHVLYPATIQKLIMEDKGNE